MRLTFTVDLPLKEPEKLLDLEKLADSDSMSYAFLRQDGSPDYRYSNFTHQSLVDHSRLVSTQIQAKKPEIERLIGKLKSAHPTAMQIEHKFPEGFGLRYPEHLAEYERSQVRFNSLHNDTFLLLDAFLDYLGYVGNLNELTNSLLENGFMDIKKQKKEIEELKSEMDRKAAEFTRREETQKAEFDTAVTAIRGRMNDLLQMCDEKDVVIDEGQRNYLIIQTERDELKGQLAAARHQIETKFRNADELSRYINSMLKDKREQAAMMEGQAKQIAELRFQLETKELEFKEALEKNREKFEGEMERERRRYEGEIFKLKDLNSQQTVTAS